MTQLLDKKFPKALPQPTGYPQHLWQPLQLKAMPTSTYSQKLQQLMAAVTEEMDDREYRRTQQIQADQDSYCWDC